jgi:AraC-like DNA-binding protein
VTVNPQTLDRVLMWIDDPADRARLMDGLRHHAAVAFVSSAPDLFARMQSSVDAPAFVILPARDERGAPIERVIRNVAAEWPRVTLVVRWIAGTVALVDLRSMTAAGAHGFLVQQYYDRATLRALLGKAWQAHAAEQVMRELERVFPPDLHPVLEAVLENPAEVTTIQALADALAIHRRTLFNRCERAASMHPTDVLGWARIALVAYHLENTGCTVERIAMDLGYPSVATLRNTLKRYTGFRATDLRSHGPLTTALGVLRARMSA